MEAEIVDLTNKLLDAKNTINRLEDLNVSIGSRDARSGFLEGLPWLLSVCLAGALQAGLQPGRPAAQMQQVAF